MDEQQREILRAVATGEMTPEEASDRLAALEADPPTGQARPEAPQDDTHGDAVRVKVIGSFRTTKIVGDPEVREIAVDGPHVIKRDGDTIIIEDDGVNGPEPVGTGEPQAFAFAHGPGTFKFKSRKRRVTIGLGSKPEPLEVRMNPNLPLDVELAAGTLKVSGVVAPITADVSAGTARIDGVASPIDVSVAAGTVHVSGLLDHGASTVRCEAGSVRIDLSKGSSVKITTRVGLGKVSVPDDAVESGGAFFIGAGAREATVGRGTGTLDIDASLGKVEVRADR